MLEAGGGVRGPDGKKYGRGSIPDMSTGKINGDPAVFNKQTGRWYNPDTGKWYAEGSNSNQSGCFITTAVCETLHKPDDCAELTKFRHFRDTFMQSTSEMKAEIKEYYYIAPKICTAIDMTGEECASGRYSAIWEDSLKPAFAALDSGDNLKAHDIYKEMVMGLKKEFLAD